MINTLTAWGTVRVKMRVACLVRAPVMELQGSRLVSKSPPFDHAPSQVHSVGISYLLFNNHFCIILVMTRRLSCIPA